MNDFCFVYFIIHSFLFPRSFLSCITSLLRSLLLRSLLTVLRNFQIQITGYGCSSIHNSIPSILILNCTKLHLTALYFNFLIIKIWIRIIWIFIIYIIIITIHLTCLLLCITINSTTLSLTKLSS
jgi:hypothetical protein